MIESRNAAAGAMGKTDLGAFDLAVTALSAQLANNFNDLGNPGRPYGMPLGKQPAAGIDRNTAAQRCLSVFEQFGRLAPRTKSQRFVIKQFGDGERVMDFSQIDIFRPDAGFLIQLFRTPHGNLR